MSLLTADELARELKVHASTVRLWTRARTIPCVRLPSTTGHGDGQARYDLAEVRSALTQPTVNASPTPVIKRGRQTSSRAPVFDLPPVELKRAK